MFSAEMPFENYFFLEKGLRIVFLDFLRALPQIINGRPLIALESSRGDIISKKYTKWKSVYT